VLQAGIGAAVGVLLVLRGWLLPDLDAASARNILGFGLVAYALVGLAGALLARGEEESWVRPLVNALLLIVLAIVLLTSTETNAADRLGLLGWIALIGGAVYLVLAWRARERAAAT
jgi:chromate transport protein ChrA